MAAILTPGMRAVSVEIEPETAAGGFILPDDRVDVIVTREIDVGGEGGGGGMQNVRADLILANVRVLAIDSTYSRPVPGEGEDPASGQGQSLVGSRATLELAERDAALLASADKAGDISLSLRSITEISGESGATGVGRVYRDGLPTEARGVRVYRHGRETAVMAPAG
jgi:pilus assembly protein CpaB